jgi:hypothetical protein
VTESVVPYPTTGPQFTFVQFYHTCWEGYERVPKIAEFFGISAEPSRERTGHRVGDVASR